MTSLEQTSCKSLCKHTKIVKNTFIKQIKQIKNVLFLKQFSC